MITPQQDELARQRAKRERRLLDAPVAGFGDLTIGDVVYKVVAAIDEHGGPLDVRSLLAQAGHSRRTIETVVAYLNVDDTTQVQPPR